ncbi:MAG: hypothetical protein KF749_12070 [Bacteroidetes bacterium]|nr:hypothetical protein [Bacteroidota bacterium]MCW5894241.1 hypothetical protein [Bacteroidota bacterium]
MHNTFLPANLPHKERVLISILIEVEMEFQAWFAVTYSRNLDEELIISCQ